MSFDFVYDLLEDIRATSSRLEKEALVQKLSQMELGSFVLKWTYDPFVTYGVKPVLVKNEAKPNMEFRATLVEPLLNSLSSRELSGRAAEREISEMMTILSSRGAEMLFWILSKDLKAGFGESTINLAVPGLVPSFKVMRANKFEERHVKAWPWKIEPKLDGQRNTFLCRNGQGAFFTRSGKVVPALDFLVPSVLKVAREAYAKGSRDLMAALSNRPGDLGNDLSLDFMLDGEAMMGLFKDSGALRRKDRSAEGAELHLYDIMSLAEFEGEREGRPLADRREQLAEFVRVGHEVLGKQGPIQIVPQYFVNTVDEVQQFFTKMLNKPLAIYLARGDKEREAELMATLIDQETGKPKMLEGAMAKDPTALYQRRKSNSWLKLKAEETEDLQVVGYYPGEKHTKYEHCLGGLVVHRKGVRVRVGGGFSDAEREEFWTLIEKDFATFSPELVSEDKDAKIAVFDLSNTNFNILGRLIEVLFHEVTPDGSLRHPRLVRFRSDKENELQDEEAA